MTSPESTAISRGPTGISKGQRRAGQVVSAACILFLLFDAAGKLMRLRVVVEGTVRLGYPETVIFPLGAVLFACTVLYLVPRTAVLGAILLTGYLGGATATHARLGQAFL